MATKDELGKHGEQVAVDYLLAHDMQILDRNWRCPDGEIDVVAREGRTLVVVEVKTRSGRTHGTAFEAVTEAKIARLRRLAGRWLGEQAEGFDAVRIDVIALERFAGDFVIRHERGIELNAPKDVSWAVLDRPPRSGGGVVAVARTHCVALVGVTGHLVEVEADVGNGMAGLHLTGMLDTALSEARDRVRSAVVNSRYAWPDARITVSLFPASLPKRGSMFDVAIAVALLAAAGFVPIAKVAEPFFLGELGLDGSVRPVRGVLPAVLAAVAAGARTVVVPARNAAEAGLVPDVTVIPAATLGQLVSWLRSDDPIDAPQVGGVPTEEEPGLGGIRGGARPVSPGVPGFSGGPGAFADPGFPTGSGASAGPGAILPDLGDVAGQPLARHALEVCAAGGHNLWMLGPPGTGKTMLAERLPTLLPSLELDQALEVTAIHSVAGVLPLDRPLLIRPPFMAPHHTATVAAIIGGGGGVIRPGAVSLAHRGVLFMDEAPEYPMSVLDSLRQPLESGRVTVSRALGSVTFPARFMLVLAANKCPCGQPSNVGDPCRCTPTVRRRYLGRLSGPLLDRVDVKVSLHRSTRRELLADRRFIEPSRVVAERVLLARERAAKRLANTPWRCNAEVSARALHTEYRPPPKAMFPLLQQLDNGRLSARGLDRVLKLAWTLADLGGKKEPELHETNSALGLWLGEEW